jgi:transcription elongation factor GreA
MMIDAEPFGRKPRFDRRAPLGAGARLKKSPATVRPWRRDELTETTMDKIPMTAAGHSALTAEYQRRTSEDRPRIIRDIAEARAHGDLSENAEYHAAKEMQSHNEGRIQELEALLALADVIDVSKLTGNSVKFGATVKILDEDTEAEKTYMIVGDQEADASAGRISLNSPIARAMMGKAVGDSFEVAAPGGSKTYEILDVKFI